MEFLYSDEENYLKDRFFDFFNMNVDKDKYTSIGICGGRSIVNFLSVFLKQNFSFRRSIKREELEFLKVWLSIQALIIFLLRIRI